MSSSQDLSGLYFCRSFLNTLEEPERENDVPIIYDTVMAELIEEVQFESDEKASVEEEDSQVPETLHLKDFHTHRAQYNSVMKELLKKVPRTKSLKGKPDKFKLRAKMWKRKRDTEITLIFSNQTTQEKPGESEERFDSIDLDTLSNEDLKKDPRSGDTSEVREEFSEDIINTKNKRKWFRKQIDFFAGLLKK